MIRGIDLHGNMLTVQNLPENVRTRLVVNEGECWDWTGAIGAYGYPVTRQNGTARPVFHVTFHAAGGERPPGGVIHHECHNKRCCNPQHLRGITRKEHAAEHGLSGWAKIHAAKTECKNGHPLDKSNSKQRYCSECRRKSSREWARREAKKKRDDSRH